MPGTVNAAQRRTPYDPLLFLVSRVWMWPCWHSMQLLPQLFPACNPTKKPFPTFTWVQCMTTVAGAQAKGNGCSAAHIRRPLWQDADQSRSPRSPAQRGPLWGWL